MPPRRRTRVPSTTTAKKSTTTAKKRRRRSSTAAAAAAAEPDPDSVLPEREDDEDDAAAAEAEGDPPPAQDGTKQTNHLLAQILNELRRQRGVLQGVLGVGTGAGGLSSGQNAAFCSQLTKVMKVQQETNNSVDNFTNTPERVNYYLKKGLRKLHNKGSDLDAAQIRALKTIIVTRLRNRRSEITRTKKSAQKALAAEEEEEEEEDEDEEEPGKGSGAEELEGGGETESSDSDDD